MKIESADTERPSSPRRRRSRPVVPAEAFATKLPAAEIPPSPDPLEQNAAGGLDDSGVVAITPAP